MFVKFCVCPSFPPGIEGRMWNVIVLIPDHCLSINFRIILFMMQFLTSVLLQLSTLMLSPFLIQFDIFM